MLVNLAGAKLCQNDILGAKETLDELLNSLDVKIVTQDKSGDSMLPAYAIHSLIYLFLKTSKLKLFIHILLVRKLQDGETTS